MPHRESDDTRFALLNDMTASAEVNSDLSAFWANMLAVRECVLGVLEDGRRQKLFGKTVELDVTLTCNGDLFSFVNEHLEEIRLMLKVSSLSCVPDDAENCSTVKWNNSHAGMKVDYIKSTAPACPRCWSHSATVGENPDHPQLCARCAAVVQKS